MVSQQLSTSVSMPEMLFFILIWGRGGLTVFLPQTFPRGIMFSLSPRGENVMSQGKDLTKYEGITPQLDTRAKQFWLRRTFAGYGGSKASLLGDGCGKGPASHLLALLAESVPGQMGWH